MIIELVYSATGPRATSRSYEAAGDTCNEFNFAFFSFIYLQRFEKILITKNGLDYYTKIQCEAGQI